jgi:hypothetical protein
LSFSEWRRADEVAHTCHLAQQKIFLDFGSMEDSFLQKWMNGHGGVFWRKQYVISSKLNKRENSVKVTDKKIIYGTYYKIVSLSTELNTNT